MMIHTFEPTLNGQVRRFGESVIRYQQVRDQRLGPGDRQLIETIASKGKFLPDNEKITKTGWKKI
jgi:hypothetical protein